MAGTDPLLMIPGPTNLPAEVREALCGPGFYHRGEQMAALLEQYGEQTAGVLAKVVGSAIVAVAGLLLWALNTNAPSNELLRLVGQIVGLAAMVGGPVFVWTVL